MRTPLFLVLLLASVGSLLWGVLTIRYYQIKTLHAILPDWSHVPLYPWALVAGGAVLLLLLVKKNSNQTR